MKNVTFTMTAEDAEFVVSVFNEKSAQLALASKSRYRATRVSAMFERAKCFRVIERLKDMQEVDEGVLNVVKGAVEGTDNEFLRN